MEGNMLTQAVIEQNIDVIRWLIHHGADINKQLPGNGTFGVDNNGHTALSIAITQEPVSVPIVELLLNYGANPGLPFSVNGETFNDLTYYLAREHTSKVLAWPMTKFSYLVSTLDHQIKMLDNPNDKDSLSKISDLLYSAKALDNVPSP